MGTSFTSATFDALYEGVLGVDVFLWLLGTLVQIVRNRKDPPQEDDDRYVIGNLPWTYLFGVRPKTEKVFITPALLTQVPALLHLLFGGLALWLDNLDAYELVTTTCWILFPMIGFIGYLVSEMRKERESTKIAKEKIEAARDENATSKTEAIDDKEPVGEQEELPQGRQERRDRRYRG
jgi:hypothetical protein